MAAFGLALLPVAAAQAQAPAIEHKAVSCIVAERFARLDACFTPADQVARARVQFRAHGTPHWYFVDMGAEGPCHSGVLPKPKRSTKKIDYYIDVVDRRFAEGRTAEHDPRVVERSGECGRDMSQSRSFTFTVAQNAVVSIDTSYVVAGTNAPAALQRSFSPVLPITNGSFSLQEQGLVLTGTFASETSASGRLEPTRVSATWQATRR